MIVPSRWADRDCGSVSHGHSRPPIRSELVGGLLALCCTISPPFLIAASRRAADDRIPTNAIARAGRLRRSLPIVQTSICGRWFTESRLPGTIANESQ